jgi:hypothetical protein
VQWNWHVEVSDSTVSQVFAVAVVWGSSETQEGECSPSEAGTRGLVSDSTHVESSWSAVPH